MAKSTKNRTPEEYEKDKKRILDGLKEGLPVRRMEAKYKYARSYINKIKSTLLTEGEISQDEIQLASREYYKKNPNAQGLDKRKVRKPKGTEKAQKRHNDSLEKREKIYEFVEQGYIKADIARTLGLSSAAVKWHIDSLIEER